MNCLRHLIPILLVLFLFPSPTRAETIRLKDGTQIEGNIGAWNADGTEFYFAPKGEGAGDEPRWIEMSDVAAIRYDGVPVRPKVKVDGGISG